MKEFTLKVEKIKEYEVNPHRRYIGIVSIAFSAFVIIFGLYSFMYSSGVLYTLVFLVPILTGLPEFFKMARNNYKKEINPVGECVLEFQEQKLLCKYKNKILWSLPFNKLSHIKTQYIGTGKWFAPKTKSTFVYSNVGANDTYPLPGAISEKDQEIIQNEIKAFKNIKAV